MSDEWPEEDEAAFQKVQALVHQLAQDFDAIQIVVGKHKKSNIASEDHTVTFTYGIGAYYARYGLVKQLAKKMDAQEEAQATEE